MANSFTAKYPEKGENVIRIGQTISLVWESLDISTVNIFFFKGNERLLITNKSVSDGKSKYNIFIDNSFFSPEFLPCKIRIEMKENPEIYSESQVFKVLRKSE